MTANPNELTIENSAVVLIDHQPWVAFGVESTDRGVLINNVTGLARATTAAWSDPNLRAAVEVAGRAKLIMAGLWTEVCLVQTVLPALKEGFDVYFVGDCSGGVSKEAHDDAKARMLQAGAKPINWAAVGAEWAPDFASPERN